MRFLSFEQLQGQFGTGDRDYPNDFSADFHTYGFDWSPTQIQWLLDDQIVHSETLERNFWPGLYNKNGSPFDQEFFIIINLAVGGMFFGGEPFDPIEADGWPKDTLEVEFVRKWVWV
jgi:beta-glucanase (GH16 family)